MKESTLVGFDAKALIEEMMQKASEEQSRRLVEYAIGEIQKLGDMIQTYNSANHMDRTGHLLNSLCWGVYYSGKKVQTGFYRSAKTQSRGFNGTSQSALHELFKDDAVVINGRQLAQEFLNSYKSKEKGWVVFFAILAPYWGYWESGHKNVFSKTFKQFQVMTHIFDDVRMALRPAETHLTVYVPKYSYKNRKYKNKRGYAKIGKQR